MAKKRSSDAYRKLVRVLIVLFVLAVICGAGYMLLDQSIQAQQEENDRRAQEENAQLEAQYRQAKAEETAKQAASKIVQWPTPKSEGWDVVDLSEYPLNNPYNVTAKRQDLLLGGMMLLNHWHSLPVDFSESELLPVYKTDKTIPVSSSSVRLFPAAITALGNMLAAAKEDGLEGYLIDEGYRSNETQTKYYEEAAAGYADRLFGDALIEKVRQTVNVPGTSEYQSGFSFRVDRYRKDDPDFMKQKFQDMPLSDWMLEHSWEYGIVFRFPVQGYPNSTVMDKSYKTGESKKLSVYRYVGEGNAAVMHALDFCMEEYIEYLMQHPHIAVYENGKLRYEITRTPGGDTYADVTVSISRAARDYSLSTDNMGGIIAVMVY